MGGMRLATLISSVELILGHNYKSMFYCLTGKTIYSEKMNCEKLMREEKEEK